jgi:acyl carrier protein
MSTPDLTPLERELREFIVTELMSPDGADSITAEEDLIRRGIVDSLGLTQLVDFCESRYGIQVTDEDLVPSNFQTVRGMAGYVERKRGERVERGERGGRLRFASRSR